MNAKIGLRENVEYIVRDENGRIKKLFQPWSWVSALIKSGHLSPTHPKLFLIFGYWTRSMNVSNLIVNTGVATVPAMLTGGTSYGFYKFIAVGTATASAAATDTALGSETTSAGLSRGTATVTSVTTDVTNDTAQLVLSFTITGTVAVTESGVFNQGGAAGLGTMLARQVFSAINVVSGDTLQITWKIDVD